MFNVRDVYANIPMEAHNMYWKNHDLMRIVHDVALTGKPGKIGRSLKPILAKVMPAAKSSAPQE